MNASAISRFLQSVPPQYPLVVMRDGVEIAVTELSYSHQPQQVLLQLAPVAELAVHARGQLAAILEAAGAPELKDEAEAMDWAWHVRKLQDNETAAAEFCAKQAKAAVRLLAIGEKIKASAGNWGSPMDEVDASNGVRPLAGWRPANEPPAEGEYPIRVWMPGQTWLLVVTSAPIMDGMPEGALWWIPMVGGGQKIKFTTALPEPEATIAAELNAADETVNEPSAESSAGSRILAFVAAIDAPAPLSVASAAFNAMADEQGKKLDAEIMANVPPAEPAATPATEVTPATSPEVMATPSTTPADPVQVEGRRRRKKAAAPAQAVPETPPSATSET